MNLMPARLIRSENPLSRAGKTRLRRLVGGSVGSQTPHADFWRLRGVLPSYARAACSKPGRVRVPGAYFGTLTVTVDVDRLPDQSVQATVIV
jgi:hypothetical protein